MAAAGRRLIVVDVQTAFVAGEAAVPAAATLLDEVATLTATARTAGALIVHLQNAGAPDQPGTPAGGCTTRSPKAPTSWRSARPAPTGSPAPAPPGS